MVKIAIAGGSGNVGQEVTDALIATGKHEILILSRKDAPSEGLAPGLTWIKAEYDNMEQLAKALEGVDTVLSFIDARLDEGAVGQKNLIDAAVQAGVRRFAPSEWASSTFEGMSWYTNKGLVREYLKELNKDKMVLEYTLFQPGVFVNYFTWPHKSSNHLHPLPIPFDFNERKALIQEGSEAARITLTLAKDFANVVAKAIEYEGEWPLVGGIKGDELTTAQLIALGEKVRGGQPFNVEKLQAEDLKEAVVKSSWVPLAGHPSFTPEQAVTFSAILTSGLLLGLAAEAWNVSDEWNRLLPDVKFTTAEEFLGDFWKGRD